MKPRLFEDLATSLRQAKAMQAGTLKGGRRRVLTKDHPAVIRSRLGLTQEEFAEMIGVSVATLQNWEQGHREPTGPAKALLTTAARYPKQVAAALRHRREQPQSAAAR